MGIHDREYARRRGGRGALGGPGWSVNNWLIGINTGVFLLMALAPGIGGVIGDYGHFSTARAAFYFTNAGQVVFGLEVWRYITFQFIHANFLHIFFNMFGLWVFGPLVEARLGGRRYLAFYLACGVFGAITYLILNVLGAMQVSLPGVLINDPHTPLVGASAGVFGVIMAAAHFQPNTVLQLIFPPVSLRMRTFAWIYFGIALFNLLIAGHNAGGDAAHVGGAIAGFFLVRRPHLLHDFFDVFSNSNKKKASRGRAGGRRRSGPDPREIDRILSKVATQGLQSLSESEKRALKNATESQRSG